MRMRGRLAFLYLFDTERSGPAAEESAPPAAT